MIKDIEDSCLSCGLSLIQILERDGPGELATIVFEPGSSGSSIDPPEPDILYFVCKKCDGAYHE